MADLTPRNRLPIPREREEPYYPTIRSFFLAVDAAHWADAENGNLTYNGGGLFTWSASSGTLMWTTPIYVTSFTAATQSRAIIQGPPAPGGVLTLEDGEVAFFTMPRLMTVDNIVTLRTGTRIQQSDGTRMHDLRLFAARSGDTLLLPYGKSLRDGESAILFGGGIGTTIPPHQHQPALIIEPVSSGISTLDLQITQLGDEKLILVSQSSVFTVGDTVSGQVSGSTGIVSAVTATYIMLTASSLTGPGFQIGETIESDATVVEIEIDTIVGTFSIDDNVTAGGATGVVRSIIGSPTPTSFYVKVTSGSFPLSGTLTDTTSGATANILNTTVLATPTADIASLIPPSNLLKVELFRNGMLQAEGSTADYTVNYTTGIITLNQATVSGSERFVALRETTPTGTGSGQHQHLRLPIPITVTTSTLDMQLTALNPSPTKLIDVDLYRNGSLLAQANDYTLDGPTGIVTLTIPAIPGEIFIANRQVE